MSNRGVKCAPQPLTSEQADIAGQWYYSAIRKAYSITHYRDYGEVVDIATDGLIDATRYFAPDRGLSFGGFLRVCIRSSFREAIRRCRSRRGQMSGITVRPPDGMEWIVVEPDESLEAREEAAYLRSVLHSRESEVVQRLFDMGQSPGEVARDLGLTPQAISHAQKRAICRMRERALRSSGA